MELIIRFQNVVFLASGASFSTNFIKIVVDIKAMKPPHVLLLWLEGKQGHAPCGMIPHLHMSYNCGWGQARAYSL